jgi:type III secretion protein S
MNHESLIQLTVQGLTLVLLISLPVSLVSAAVGLLVSLVQAITSLQDQTVSQAVKLLVVTVVLLLAAPWAGSLVLQYAQQVILASSG